MNRYTANVWLSVTPDGVALADPELRSVVLAEDHDALEAKYAHLFNAMRQVDSCGGGPECKECRAVITRALAVEDLTKWADKWDTA